MLFNKLYIHRISARWNRRKSRAAGYVEGKRGATYSEHTVSCVRIAWEVRTSLLSFHSLFIKFINFLDIKKSLQTANGATTPFLLFRF